MQESRRVADPLRLLLKKGGIPVGSRTHRLAARVSIDDIEAILTRHGVVVGHGWWNHFKEGHYYFVDQNVKDNAAHLPTCCSKMPPGAGRSW
jgi:hypothetical protein